MAVRFDAAADRLLRTANLINYNAAYTVAFWMYIVNLPGAGSWAIPFALNDGDTTDRDNVEIQQSTSTVYGYSRVGDVGGSTASTGEMAVVASTWYHVALVRASTTSLEIYLNAVASGTVATKNVASRTGVTRAEFGALGTADSYPFDGRIAYIKAWTAALSAAQITAEKNSIRPLSTASLYGWWLTWPGTGIRTADYSGNGYNWTAGGTLTDEVQPLVGGNIYRSLLGVGR